jgi:hypothetical protein
LLENELAASVDQSGFQQVFPGCDRATLKDMARGMIKRVLFSGAWHKRFGRAIGRTAHNLQSGDLTPAQLRKLTAADFRRGNAFQLSGTRLMDGVGNLIITNYRVHMSTLAIYSVEASPKCPSAPLFDPRKPVLLAIMAMK